MVTTYDRSQLIDRAIDNLSHKLLEELSSSPGLRPVPVARALGAGGISLPLGLCFAFIMMHFQGSTPTSCRWAGSPLRWERWSMPPS